MDKWWVIAGAAFLGGLVAWFIAPAQSARVLARMLDEVTRRRLEDRQRQIDSMKDDVSATAEHIEAAEERLRNEKAALAERYESRGLSAEEIADRFRRIRL
jgi:flagellar motility protein MotE (MotC chaperone)